MSEYQLPGGDDKWLESRDEVCQGYVEAMFFTEANPDNEDLADADVSMLSSEARERICKDCMAFQATPAWKRTRGLLDSEFDDTQAGRDFWYTRNGHGAGFWDGDYAEPYATQLSDAASAFGSVDLYKGDDGKLYLS